MKLKKVLIAGQEGMVGSAVLNLLKKNHFKIINCKRKDLDFTNQKNVQKWFKKHKPDIVINAAGKVGGILDNSTNPIDYIYQNTMIGYNLISASLKYGVNNFINLGSVSSYPKKVKVPIQENSLLSSFLEQTNEAYAISKIATIKYCQYIREKLNKNYISLQPANLYGIGDKFNIKKSHVIPSLIMKFHEAKIKNKKFVEIWGSGKVKREFLYVEDLASAIVFCLKKKIKHSILNVGSNSYITIYSLAVLIKKITNFKGRLYFNTKYPDGSNNRKLDSSKIKNLGWKPKIKLEKGLIQYYKNFIKYHTKY